MAHQFDQMQLDGNLEAQRQSELEQISRSLDDHEQSPVTQSESRQSQSISAIDQSHSQSQEQSLRPSQIEQDDEDGASAGQ